ncbi:hypothetical protein D918_05286 [Trichuris suis]|nr:hypothetical protein D918_05286 [Trichuris suis]
MPVSISYCFTPAMKSPSASMPFLQPSAVPYSSFGLNPPVDPGRTIVRSVTRSTGDDAELDAPAHPQQVLLSEEYVKHLEGKAENRQSEPSTSSHPSKKNGNKCAELIINAYNSLFRKDSADISKGLFDAMRQYLS